MVYKLTLLSTQVLRLDHLIGRVSGENAAKCCRILVSFKDDPFSNLDSK